MTVSDGKRLQEAGSSRLDRKQKLVMRGFHGSGGNNAIASIFSSRFQSAREVMQNPRYLSMKSRCRRTVRREIFNLVGTNGRSIRLGPRLSSASFQDPCLVHQISTKLLACNCPPRQRKRSDISSNP